MRRYSLTRWNFAAAYVDTFTAENDQAAILYAKRLYKSNDNVRLYSLENKSIIFSKDYN